MQTCKSSSQAKLELEQTLSQCLEPSSEDRKGNILERVLKLYRNIKNILK